MAPGARSSHAHGEPYSVSRSRKGCAGSASGPRTPAPDQAPESISSSATTGLTAVCQTTACDPYSAIDQALSTTWYRYTSRGAPSLPVPVTQVPAQVRPVILAPSPAGSGRQAATTSRGDTCAAPTATGAAESSPSLCRTLSTAMNSAPRPYLNVTRLASIQRGISSTSSCSTFTHSTGPMPAGKSNTSGSLNGSVVNQPRSRSQMTGGLRHSSIVVQIEKVGAKSYPATTRFAPSLTPMSRISLNMVSAACRAKMSDSPGSTPMPTIASFPRSSHWAASANCSSQSLTPVLL